MEFLVHIEIRYPADGDPEELARLVAAERVRGAELAAAGTIRRLWRVPGRRANWGVWEALDATALDAEDEPGAIVSGRVEHRRAGQDLRPRTVEPRAPLPRFTQWTPA